MDADNFVRREFLPALKRAGLPRIRFHDLRHAFASLLIARALPPKLISEQLGHASIAITMERYGHLFDQSYADASDSIEAALFDTPLCRSGHTVICKRSASSGLPRRRVAVPCYVTREARKRPTQGARAAGDGTARPA